MKGSRKWGTFSVCWGKKTTVCLGFACLTCVCVSLSRSLLQQLQSLQAVVAGKVHKSCRVAGTQTSSCLMVLLCVCVCLCVPANKRRWNIDYWIGNICFHYSLAAEHFVWFIICLPSSLCVSAGHRVVLCSVFGELLSERFDPVLEHHWNGRGFQTDGSQRVLHGHR